MKRTLVALLILCGASRCVRTRPTLPWSLLEPVPGFTLPVITAVPVVIGTTAIRTGTPVIGGVDVGTTVNFLFAPPVPCAPEARTSNIG